MCDVISVLNSNMDMCQCGHVSIFFARHLTLCRFAIQFKLKPALVALRYYDGMKGGTVALLCNLLLKLDEYYSKPIKGLDEAMCKKMHNVFMSRWSAFHAPIHSAAFATDKQFFLREMDEV
jgi:hypothetical protein